MKIVETNSPDAQLKEQIMRLWNNEYPEQLRYADVEGFDNYLNNLQECHHLLAMNDSDNLVGWAFSFARDGERWFAIIVDGSLQGKGLGTTLLNRLKENEPTLNGWVTDHDRYVKANGEAYRSPLRFYLQNGFAVLPETRLEIENLSAVKIRWVNASV